MKRIVESHYPGALEKNLTLSKERWLVLQGCFCRHRSQLTINILTLLCCVLAASIVHMYQSAYGHVDFNFATVGDFGCTANTNATVTNIRDKNPELVLALGDYSYAYTADCWLDRIQSLNNITKINIGNHEDEISDRFDEYMNHFGLTEPYYSYDYQNVHVLTMTFETSYSIGNPQYDFVVSDLQSASQNASIDWIVVNLHDWVYRASSSNPLYNDFAVIYHPLFDKYDVDLVLSGHSHNYHRTYPLKYNPNNPTSPLIIDNDTNDYIDPRGQVYAVVGTGGINLHPIIGSSQFVASNQDDFFGQLDIKFTNNGGKLEGRFYRNGDNAVLDIFSITKSRVTGSGTYHYTPSLALTGSNYNDTRSSSSLQLSQFSAAAWFKTSATFSSNAFIVNKGGIGSDSRGNNMNYGIWMTGSEKIQAGFEAVGGADHFVITANTYNDGQWHYAVVTYDGSNVILYIDGTQVGTNSTLGASPGSSGTKPVRVGANSRVTPPGNFFRGTVDEVRVWNDDLTRQEVANASAGSSFNTAEQVLYLPFGSSPPIGKNQDVVLHRNSSESITLRATDPDSPVLDYTIVTQPENGTLSGTAPNLTYNPNLDHVGSDSFAFKADDGTRDSNIAAVSITVNPPWPPVAKDEIVDVTKNTSESINLTATDPDSPALDYRIVTQPENGTLSGTSANLTYNPGMDFVGMDSFTFRANDGTLDSNMAKVTINVIEKPQGGYNYYPDLALTGSNYNDTRSSSSLQLSHFSAAAWFKTSANFSSKAFIVNKGGIGSDIEGNNMNYGIWMTSSEKIRAGFETSNGADHFVTTTGTYNDNQWHYVMVTYDGSSVILYIDGTQVDTKSTLGASPESSGTKPVRVGANSGATPPDNFFTGNVDEVRVWNDDLTRQEVASAFAGTSFNNVTQVLHLDAYGFSAME